MDVKVDKIQPARIKILSRLQSLVYPHTCILCLDASDTGRDLCEPCFAELPRNLLACPVCAEPMAASALCGRCQQKLPSYDKIYAPFIYDFPISQMIAALKFQARLSLSPLLAEILGDELQSSGAPMPDILLPVPLHSSRLADRGFNQALELARPLSRRFAIPIDKGSLIRAKSTDALSRLDRKQRQKSIRGVFQQTRDISAQHVAIIDDVVTTGSTVAEMARMLRKAGVTRVDVWAIARTPERSYSSGKVLRIAFD